MDDRKQTQHEPLLGLRRGWVALADHRAAWSAAFEAERERLTGALGSEGFRVEHIGSTSVPGLPAKPILDIAVLVMRPELLPDLAGTLTSIGYLDRGDQGDDGGHLFAFETSAGLRSIHLHAHLDGDGQWDAYLRFRDALRADSGLRDAYARLKRRLAETMPNDRPGYTAGKAAFIQRVLTSLAA